MHWVLFLALSAVAAILFNPVYAFMNGKASSSTNPTAQKFFGSYVGKTSVLAVAFFLVLVVAASLLRLVAGSKAEEIPVVG